MAQTKTPDLVTTPFTGFDREFARNLEKEIRGQLPEEKVKANLRQIRLANIMRQAGSLQIDGLGQLKARIDPRLFFRWELEYPGCWKNKDFVKKMLKDNPHMRAPGYKA